jgi:hypothetical protein
VRDRAESPAEREAATACLLNAGAELTQAAAAVELYPDVVDRDEKKAAYLPG